MCQYGVCMCVCMHMCNHVCMHGCVKEYMFVECVIGESHILPPIMASFLNTNMLCKHATCEGIVSVK